MARRANPKRWTESHASEVLDRADRSGLSDRAFGKRNRIDPQRLSFWRQRLGRKRPRGGSGSFVEVRARSSQAVVAHMEIQLTNGRTVRVPATIDSEVLAELLDVIEGRSC